MKVIAPVMSCGCLSLAPHSTPRNNVSNGMAEMAPSPNDGEAFEQPVVATCATSKSAIGFIQRGSGGLLTGLAQLFQLCLI